MGDPSRPGAHWCARVVPDLVGCLLDEVRRAAAGETVLAPPVQRRLVERVRDPEAGALSQREIEVLREVASGHTNAEIAERLHISQATVKTHLLHIYDKLGVTDRAAAVARAYETRILSRHHG